MTSTVAIVTGHGATMAGKSLKGCDCCLGNGLIRPHQGGDFNARIIPIKTVASELDPTVWTVIGRRQVLSSKLSKTFWREAMRRKRRTHSPEFKAKVAMAAIQGDLTMTELVKKFDVHANQVTDWKKQLLSGAPDVFDKGAKKAQDAGETVQELHAKIGQLTMENDF